MTSHPTAIRAVERGDEDGLAAMLSATGLFPEHELAEVMSMLAGHLEGSLDGEHRWAVGVEGGRPLGAAYWAPERMTDGTWNLYMLAVHPERHGQGLGQALVRHVERSCAAEGVRLLLVETLGTPAFEPQRRFYRTCGYEEEGRIRDFYGDGFDKVIFRKRP
jgi:ribosomal protein S18 acetylase RimI-like enzyme